MSEYNGFLHINRLLLHVNNHFHSIAHHHQYIIHSVLPLHMTIHTLLLHTFQIPVLLSPYMCHKHPLSNAPIIPLSASISPLMSVTQHASNIYSTIIPSSDSISALMSVTQHASIIHAPIIPSSASISPLLSVTQHALNIHAPIIPSSVSISPLMSVTQHASDTIIHGSQVLQQSISFLCTQFSGAPAPIKKC